MDDPATVIVVSDAERHVGETGHERRARLNERLRPAFIEGAEQDSMRCLGRRPTPEELVRVLRRYPGDI